MIISDEIWSVATGSELNRRIHLSGPVKRELLVYHIQLHGAILQLVVEILDQAKAAADGIRGAGVGFVDHGHHEVVRFPLIDGGESSSEVSHAEELVYVQKVSLLVSGEMRSQRTIRRTFPPLVLANRASSASAGGGCGGGVCFGGVFERERIGRGRG